MRRNFGPEALTGVDETNTAPCRWKKKRPARGRLLLDYYFLAALRVFRFFFIAIGVLHWSRWRVPTGV